ARPQEQRVREPPVAELPDRHVMPRRPEPRPRPLARRLRLRLRAERPRSPEHLRHAHIARAGHMDLRSPPAAWQLADAHAALLSLALAQAIATLGRNRRARTPQVSDGIPSRTRRS